MNHTSVLLAIAIHGALLGCAAGTDDGARVDPASLQNALDNQARMAANGLTLDGRVWLAPDSYLAFFSGGGRQVQLPMIRATEEGSARWEAQAAEPGEGYAAYLARLGGPVAAVADGAGADVALFAPTDNGDEDGAATEAAALSNEHCNLTAFDQQCAHELHLRGRSHVDGGSTRVSALRGTWKVHDRTSDARTFRNTSVRHVLCADRGTIDVSFVLSNMDFTPGSFVNNFTVPEGAFTVADANAGFRHSEYCTAAIPFCIDWVVDMLMNRFDTTITTSPRTTGANYHWCGSLSELSNYRFSEDAGDRCAGTDRRPLLRRVASAPPGARVPVARPQRRRALRLPRSRQGRSPPPRRARVPAPVEPQPSRRSDPRARSLGHRHRPPHGEGARRRVCHRAELSVAGQSLPNSRRQNPRFFGGAGASDGVATPTMAPSETRNTVGESCRPSSSAS